MSPQPKGAAAGRREVDVARPIVSYLEAMQWDVYQEVTHAGIDRRADIVGIQGNLIWVVEAKQALTFDLIERAHAWRSEAHFISVAVPWSRRGRGGIVTTLLRDLGIGLFAATTYGGPGGGADQILAPRLRRRELSRYGVDRLRAACTAERKTWGEAGNATQRYFTEFRGTCDHIVAYLKKRGGAATVKEVVDGIEHHYRVDSVARSCLLKWARVGKIPGVAIEYRSGPPRQTLFVLAAANDTPSCTTAAGGGSV